MAKKKAKKPAPGTDGRKIVATNRRARHDYFIDENLEAGIVLVGTEALFHNITMFNSSLVYGTVYSPDGIPLPDVSLALYSNELSDGTSPVLVGLTQTNTSGEFVVPVPTP